MVNLLDGGPLRAGAEVVAVLTYGDGLWAVTGAYPPPRPSPRSLECSQPCEPLRFEPHREPNPDAAQRLFNTTGQAVTANNVNHRHAGGGGGGMSGVGPQPGLCLVGGGGGVRAGY